MRFWLFIVLLGWCQISPAGPKNILFIAVDDLRPELGCYGANYAQSPNLDRLASEGLLFKNHFVAVPTCGASRFALLTGRSPANSGVTRSNGAFYSGKTALSKTLLPGAQTFPELFRRSGYETTLIGKISHTADGRVFEYDGSGDGRPELPFAWDHYDTPMGSWDRGWGVFFAYANGRHREAQDPSRALKDIAEFQAIDDSSLPDGQLTDAAIARLNLIAAAPAGERKPFLMGLGFIKPHLPFVAPKQDWDAFEGVDIPLPPHPEKPIESAHWHRSGEFFKYDFPSDSLAGFPKKMEPLPPESVKTLRRAYLACVRYMDRQLGRVLDTLDDTGLADDTVVIVWGDHGWNLGDSEMWAKHTPYERAVRSPLIIRAPSITIPGTTTTALTETTDLYPTLIELCTPDFTKTAHPLNGISLVPVLKKPTSTVRDAALSYWGPSVTARNEDYRLIATRRKDGTLSDVELYSLEETGGDPVANLAETYPEVVSELIESIGE